jgi:hypothetical protein
MLSIDPLYVRRIAEEELRHEEFRSRVDQEKARLRNRATLWARIKGLMPFTITIKRSTS